MEKSEQAVLVIGAGELGVAVLAALAKHPLRDRATISAMLRPGNTTGSDSAKASQINHLQSLGIAPVFGDIEKSSVDQLSQQFAAYDTIISCSGMTGSAGLQAKLVKAALNAKVRRYVPWQFGVDYDVIGRGSAQDLFTEQLEVRDMLRGQTQMQWLIFSVGIFMSFIFQVEFGMVDLQRAIVRAFGSWDNQLTATTVEDIGAVVATAVLDGNEVWAEGSGIVYVAGDTLDYNHLADAISRVLGKEVHRELWSVDTMTERLRQDPSNGFKKYGLIWAEGRGVAWDKATSFNARRAMTVTDVETWARGRMA